MNKALHLLIIASIALSAMGQSLSLNIKNKFIPKQPGYELFDMSITTDISNLNQVKSSTSDKMQLDSLISQTWDEEGSQWILSGKEIYGYDEEGKNISDQRLVWNQINNQWEYDYKSEYTYNEDGNIKEYLHCNWNDEDSGWMCYSKEQLTYNLSGGRESYYFFEWNESSGSWDTSYIAKYFYDTIVNITTVLSFQFNDYLNKWDTTSKTEYHSNEFSKDTLQMYFTKNDSSGIWYPMMKIEYDYDSTVNNTSYCCYLAKDSLHTLSPNLKVTYSYDEFNNWDVIYSYEWNSSDSTWELESKSKITYDYSFSKEDFVLPYFYTGYNFNNMLFQSVSYSRNEEDWIMDDLTTYYFSVPHTTSGLNTNESEQRLKVFPNPASDYIMINLNDQSGIVELYDLQGRLVLSQEVQNELPVSVLQLNNGIYFYRVNSEGVVSTGKLIIKK